MSLFTWHVKAKEVDTLVKELEVLRNEKKQAREALEELKLKNRLEAEEIKHMVRIHEEKNKMECEQEKVRLAKESAEAIAKFREEQRLELVKSLSQFHEKMEGRFNSELGNLKEIYQALMARMPNVNLTLEKRLK
jgi:predicted RND superfamily exporter protein